MSDPITQKRNILLVDDDKFLLDMYALKFTKAGYDVHACDATELAIQTLRDGFKPDVVLVDIVMPGMDGLDFIQKIREDKLIGDATVITLTNQGASEDIARSQKVKVDGYIVKATTIPSEVLVEVEKIHASKVNGNNL